MKMKVLLLLFGIIAANVSHASPIYWNVFNIEGESEQSAVTVTYNSLTDMLNDTNRTGSFLPDGFNAGQNIVGAGSDGSNYWNVFNIEGESEQSAVTVTYDSLTDMLNDTNRTGPFLPDGFNAGQNIVGAGSDGSSYWNIFNIEGESEQSAVSVTYDSLTDMLNDTNRTGNFLPGGFNAGQNIVGSGSDGSSYWNIFNIEGESEQSAVTVTYDSLTDMLNDTNRTGSFLPDGFNAGQNIVGSGAFWVPEPSPVPLPGSGLLIVGGLAAAAFIRGKSRSGKSSTASALAA